MAPARVNTSTYEHLSYDKDRQGECVKCGTCGTSNKGRKRKGECVKCGTCGTSNKGRKRKSGIYACQVIKEGMSFTSNQTDETYNIRQHINCRSENIIYLVTWYAGHRITF